MDEAWLNKLDAATAVIVPTRSLATLLHEAVAEQYSKQQVSVWETPNILTWSDYLGLLWQSNRQYFNQIPNANSLISNQQSLLIWIKVIEQSRRAEQQLTLLNVQQTARAVQRSWRMMHDWQISIASGELEHVADTLQFMQWVGAYTSELKRRGFIDETLLLNQVLQEQLSQPFNKLIWYAYDLLTTAQRAFNQRVETLGVRVVFRTLEVKQKGQQQFHSHTTSDAELSLALTQARKLVEERPDAKINIVIPDLQSRRSRAQELARQVFYPGANPLSLKNENLAYRFSLGEALNKAPAIETALAIINLLKGRVSISELGLLFRNQFIGVNQSLRSESRKFEAWMQKRRMNNFAVRNLPDLYQLCRKQEKISVEHEPASGLDHFLVEIREYLDELDKELDTQKKATGFRALAFSRWYEIINQWLDLWGWNTAAVGDKLHSDQFQLHQRWQKLMEEFAALGLVQKQVGLSRGYEILQQMARDTIFLPKTAAAPILISGLYEAIGRPVDVCLLTGMDDLYPPALPADPFLANSLRQSKDYPAATSQSHFAQSQRVINSLLAGASTAIISYARQQSMADGFERGVSPLFRQINFLAQIPPTIDVPTIKLTAYQDIQGSAWQGPQRIKGGTAIFKNQSNCAFRAFVTHQLGFDSEQEPEFGLDALDRGNVVHRLLEKLWARLKTQSRLKTLMTPENYAQLVDLLETVIEAVARDPQLRLDSDKVTLLNHEKPRLKRLLMNWLEADANRPTGFTVADLEQRRDAEFAGIGFQFIIDRLDRIDDGRQVIIDYKTGTVAKRDWQGERMRDPQLPLYVVVLDQMTSKPVSGIAYAKVKQQECKYEALSEVNIFKAESKPSLTLEQDWYSNRAAWPTLLTQLANDFMAGNAKVNPIDDKSCDYCKLHSVCRVSQLKQKITESNEAAS